MLLSVLYLALVVFTSYSIYEDNADYLKDKERKIVARINNAIKDNTYIQYPAPYIHNNIPDIDWNKYELVSIVALSDSKNKDGSDAYVSKKDIEEHINLITKNQKIDFSAIEGEYKSKILKQRLRHVFYTSLVWIIPSLLVYAFGYGVGWVIQGFKKGKNIV